MKRRRIGRDVDHSPIMRRDVAALGDLFAFAADADRERSLRLRAEDPAAIALEREDGNGKDEK